MDNLKSIAAQFAIEGGVVSVEPFGAGLINDTYRVTTSPASAPDAAGGGAEGAGDPQAAPGYVLQRINHAIFRDVPLLQRNIARITDHIRGRLAARGESDIERKALRLIPTRRGELFHFDGANYWRMTRLIPGARSYEQVTPELAFETGRAFGDFQGMLSDLPTEAPDGTPDPLGATIPDFHNMEFRLSQLRTAIEHDRAGRVAQMQPVIDQIMQRAEAMTAPQRDGTLPRRITHCDTKVNNVLFDTATGRVLCVVDLDTTMPGYVMSDFGDFIRTAANTGAEDDPDPSRVGLNMQIFKAFASGYLASAGSFLTAREIELLPFGARLLTYMQAVRFLSDYLDGDLYYKVSGPDHNRVRTVAQMAMLASLEAHENEMKEYIKSLKY